MADPTTVAFSSSVTHDDGTVIIVSGNMLVSISATASLTDVQIVPPPPPPPPLSLEPVIPADAVTIDMLPNLAWKMNHDPATPGSSVGTTTYPFTAPDGSKVRRFKFTLDAHGGEIYHAQVMADSSKFNSFCYEYVLWAVSAADLANLQNIETDLEHVWADGSYVDLAMQLASGTKSVEVTENGHWVATPVFANPVAFLPNVLHTVRHYSIDNGDKTVTYVGSYIDGVYAPIGITIGDKRPGPWQKNDLNLQLQFDGKSSGSVQSTIYMPILRVHCWFTALG